MVEIGWGSSRSGGNDETFKYFHMHSSKKEKSNTLNTVENTFYIS